MGTDDELVGADAGGVPQGRQVDRGEPGTVGHISGAKLNLAIQVDVVGFAGADVSQGNSRLLQEHTVSPVDHQVHIRANEVHVQDRRVRTIGPLRPRTLQLLIGVEEVLVDVQGGWI